MQDNRSSDRKTTIAAARERQRVMTSMLELCGEVGYRRASVETLQERIGPGVDIRAHFSGLAACFVAAHEAEVERLYTDLRSTAFAPASCRDGLRAGLEQLFRFVIERPSVSRAIFREVYVAAGPALVKHDEVMERLSLALDDACRSSPEMAQPPPPLAAAFMVGGVEEFIRIQLAIEAEGRLLQAVPGLMHLIVGPYFGDEAAVEESRRPPPTQ